jgi:hypothetical protein
MAAFLHQLFSIDELNALDVKELEILKQAIRHEMATSPEIREILRTKALQVYPQLRPGYTPEERSAE